MQLFFLIVHVLAAVSVVVLVLLQHGRGADAGAAFGSGTSGTLFGARGPASFLTRITAVLAAVFFLTSLALAYMVAHSEKRESVIEKLRDENAQSILEKEISIPPVPSVPLSDSAGLSAPQEGSDPLKGSNVDIPAVPTPEGPVPNESATLIPSNR
uniref:Protein-export membrane protein SecG n=1 Tax=Candidatus Kentrum eta TaxID=2126337 RepID=A0A450V302_9GAMM|nr:MAG: preprotein translocase subunit SecG [Candidatus Kentron sp. H]VFJ99153.1 MAG: preprotein translocase subunit SecG [Candidatus Kentron sp. H]VFK03810.1 MAG: preprotein translocase subunit SecG [Candidatus Kentron sp. H]